MAILADDNAVTCFEDDLAVDCWEDDLGNTLCCDSPPLVPGTGQVIYLAFLATAVVVTTSYANPGGTGDRTGSITVTTNLTAGTGLPSALVDGPTGASYWWLGAQSGGLVVFDFGTARVIDEFKWFQDTAANHGTWDWQGSNDGSSYVTIGSSFLLGSAVGAQTVSVPNVTYYRYYRLRQLSGVTTTEPFLQEAQFKISP